MAASSLVHAIGLAMNEEAVQVGIIPAHHNLEGVMEIGQTQITWYQHASPDRRADLQFERGLRVTDAQTLEVVCMVLRGQINEHLVLMVEAHKLIEAGVISGGMIPKVEACLSALTAIPGVHVVDGGEPHILLYEISNKPSIGTMIVRDTADKKASQCISCG